MNNRDIQRILMKGKLRDMAKCKCRKNDEVPEEIAKLADALGEWLWKNGSGIPCYLAGDIFMGLTSPGIRPLWEQLCSCKKES
jgi:hypothetical protein